MTGAEVNPDLTVVNSPARAIALVLLLVATMSGMATGPSPCEHGTRAVPGHEHHAPPEPAAPCSHDQSGMPAGQCAIMPACAATPALSESPGQLTAPVVVGTLQAVVVPSLRSHHPTLDTPPPRA